MNQQNTISAEDASHAQVLEFVITTLQQIGKNLDEEMRSRYSTEEEYREKTRIFELLKTREGVDFLLISALISFIAKNPEYAYIVARLITHKDPVESIVNLLNMFDIEADSDGNISLIVMNQEDQ